MSCQQHNRARITEPAHGECAGRGARSRVLVRCVRDPVRGVRSGAHGDRVGGRGGARARRGAASALARLLALEEGAGLVDGEAEQVVFVQGRVVSEEREGAVEAVVAFYANACVVVQ